jgi:Poly A polymerase regulatory subunit
MNDNSLYPPALWQGNSPIILFSDKRIQKLPYSKKAEYSTSTIFGYLGQWKLLLSSISFLTNAVCSLSKQAVVSSAYTILYVGAAPGLSIPILDRMFGPMIKQWILYDPEGFVGPFCDELRELEKVSPDKFIIRREYFTTETATKLSKELDPDSLLCMFDQRTDNKDPVKMTADFMLSCNSLEILRPMDAWCKLRFRWPESGEDVEKGIGGTIEIQPWTAQCSAETRLVVKRSDIDEYNAGKITEYNLQHYEQTMFGYNLGIRWQIEIETNCLVKGFDRGNDSQLTIYIIGQYLEWSLKKIPNIAEVEELILNCEVSFQKSRGRKKIRSLFSTPVGILPGMSWKVRISKPVMKNAVNEEKTLQTNKKSHSKSPTKKKTYKGGSAPSKKCSSCKKSFKPRKPKDRFCSTCYVKN